MWARDGVKKGANVPDKYGMKELANDPEKIERKAKEARTWIQAGMKEDAKR